MDPRKPAKYDHFKNERLESEAAERDDALLCEMKKHTLYLF